MSSSTGWYPLTNQGVQWDENGKPYYNRSDGNGRSYIPAISAAQYHPTNAETGEPDPEGARMVEWARNQGVTLTPGANGQSTLTRPPDTGAGFWHGPSEFDSSTGDSHNPFNWGNLLALGIAGGIGGPLIGAALGGGGGGAGAGAAAGSGAEAGTAGAAGAGTLASTTIAPTLGTLAPGVAASGAVPAALAGGGAAAGAGTLAASTIAPTVGALTPGGIATGAIPAATGATAMGVPWGEIIRTAAQTAGDIYQSNQAADASTNASQAQVAAVNRAIDLQQNIYTQNRMDTQRAIQGYNPYQQIGQSSLANLYRMTGQTPPPPTPQAPAQDPRAALLPNMNSAPFPTQDALTAADLRNLARNPAPSNAPIPTGGTPGTLNTVLLRGPDGSTKQVPADQAAQWIQRGATQVG